MSGAGNNLARFKLLYIHYRIDYFNYLLNNVEFVNGLALRNRYIHGVQQVNLDELEHASNYNILLMVFTILAIKINDDFCIRDDNRKGT